MQKARKNAEIFLAAAKDFRLGNLPTEQRHPATRDLAELSRKNPHLALEILHSIDVTTVGTVLQQQPSISRLSESIHSTLKSGGRVFFYGCGATGRLSLSIEYVWRLCNSDKNLANQVVGFMSGGDLALVHSIENFEDHPEFGARQLREFKFGKNDLLVSCTEGGETPSVIGATEEALKYSKRKPWFLYCNPDEVLLKHVERSRRVLENPKIEKICLFVGPMSLSGSTRLQATTALQLAAGVALFSEQISMKDLAEFHRFLQNNKYGNLIPFIEAESKAYSKNEFLLYETKEYAITVLTDTTERSPTFSLPGFENQKEKKSKPSLAYVCIPGTKSSKEAWNALLLREPRALEWKVLNGIAGKKRLIGFDFSEKLPALRKKKIGNTKLRLLQIHRKQDNIEFRLGKIKESFTVKDLHPLFEHLYLKLLLNVHSTLVMGRIGRFESNVMTWVRPSNFKLIDRAIRYAESLLAKDNIEYSYSDIAYQLFEESEKMTSAESVVLKTVAAMKAKQLN